VTTSPNGWKSCCWISASQTNEDLDSAGDGGAHNNAAAQAKAMKPVEADWDSDED
jgi:hypothetical protein